MWLLVSAAAIIPAKDLQPGPISAATLYVAPYLISAGWIIAAIASIAGVPLPRAVAPEISGPLTP
jgi:hypothetical protein